MMPGGDLGGPAPWASESIPSWVSELSRDLPGRRPDRFDHLDLDADDRDDDWQWPDDHPAPASGTPREAAPYRYSTRAGVHSAPDDRRHNPDRSMGGGLVDRRRIQEQADDDLDNRVPGERGRTVLDRDAPGWADDARWRRNDRNATGRARVPQPRTDDVPDQPLGDDQAWDDYQPWNDDRRRDDRGFVDDRRARGDFSTDDRFDRERLPNRDYSDDRIRPASQDHRSQEDRSQDDRRDIEPNPWIIEQDDIRSSADLPRRQWGPAPDRNAADLGRRAMPAPSDQLRNKAESSPHPGGAGRPGGSARDVDPTAPRVVSKATPSAIPRVISRSTPPAVPKAISRSTPPPAPRVVGGGAPAVGPRSITPPPPPTVRAPAGAPPIVTRPPGIRSSAIPSAVTAFPATPQAVLPARVPPSVDTGAGRSDAIVGEGAKVIPLHRPRPAPAGHVNTGPINATSPPIVSAIPQGYVGTPPSTPGEQYIPGASGSATSTAQAPSGTATPAGSPRAVDALLDAIAPTELLPVALLPASEPIERKAAPQEPPAPAEPSAEEAFAAIRWRLDGATLREVVDDRESLRALSARLDQPLSESADNATRARLLCLRAEIFRLLDELGMAAAASRLALAHAEATGEPHTVVIAQGELAHTLRLRGDFDEADRLFEQAASADVPELLRCVVHENAGRCCFDQGRYMEALDHFTRAIRLGDPQDLDLVERIDVALEAVYIRLLRDGWGPYPRLRREILTAPAPQAAVTAAPERPQVWPGPIREGLPGPAPRPGESPAPPPQPGQVHAAHRPAPIAGTAWIPAQARSDHEGSAFGRERVTARAQVSSQPQIAAQAQVVEQSEAAGPA